MCQVWDFWLCCISIGQSLYSSLEYQKSGLLTVHVYPMGCCSKGSCKKRSLLTALVHIWAGVSGSALLWGNPIFDILTFRKIAHDVKLMAWCLATRRLVSRQLSDKCDWFSRQTIKMNVCVVHNVASQWYLIHGPWATTYPCVIWERL